MISATDFIARSADLLAGSGFTVERGPALAEFAPALYARKSGRSLGIFFPYDDYWFFHDFTDREREMRAEFEGLHEKARNFVNGLYRFPRWMRYRVPNVSTVAVSGGGFGIDFERYVHSIQQPWTGGERNSVFLVDLLNRRLVSTGLEVTDTEMVAVTFKKVNPRNRAHGVMTELCADFFGVSNPR